MSQTDLKLIEFSFESLETKFETVAFSCGGPESKPKASVFFRSLVFEAHKLTSNVWSLVFQVQELNLKLWSLVSDA